MDGQVTLAGKPGSGLDDDARLGIGLGHLDSAGSCVIDAVTSTRTSGYDGTTYTFVGYNSDYFPTPPRPWDCVLVAVNDLQDPNRFYDAMVEKLTPTYAAARLKVSAGKLRLVRGIWTSATVTVKNTGDYPAPSVLLRGRGKGLKVRPASYSSALNPGASIELTARVKLTGPANRTRLRWIATGGQVSGRTTATVRRIAPPPPPKPGRYVGSAATVSFRIDARRRVVGFIDSSIRLQCTDSTLDRTTALDFPTAPIRRNGWVEASVEKDSYTTTLRMYASGTTVRQGSFTYTDAAQCSASVSFTATRRK